MTYYKDEATAIDYLIAFLFSCKSTRIMNSILWERVNKRRLLKKSTFNRNINRLKEKGIIKKDKRGIEINRKKLNDLYKHKLIHIKPKNTGKIILIFDIPEKERVTRNWLRKQLKLWDFVMIQQSVWFGAGPLPDEFLERAKLLNLKKYIKIYNVEKRAKDIKI